MFLLWDGFRLRTPIYKDGYVKGPLYHRMVMPKDGYIKGRNTPPPLMVVLPYSRHWFRCPWSCFSLLNVLSQKVHTSSLTLCLASMYFLNLLFCKRFIAGITTMFLGILVHRHSSWPFNFYYFRSIVVGRSNTIFHLFLYIWPCFCCPSPDQRCPYTEFHSSLSALVVLCWACASPFQGLM